MDVRAQAHDGKNPQHGPGPAGDALAVRELREGEGMSYLPPIVRDQPPANERELFRMAFRSELFQQHGWDEERAGRWADHLLVRDREGDDRRLCCECRNLLSQWRCAKRGPVMADTLQRCEHFNWAKPKS
jgi:hypothetical protein